MLLRSELVLHLLSLLKVRAHLALQLLDLLFLLLVVGTLDGCLQVVVLELFDFILFLSELLLGPGKFGFGLSSRANLSFITWSSLEALLGQIVNL